MLGEQGRLLWVSISPTATVSAQADSCTLPCSGAVTPGVQSGIMSGAGCAHGNQQQSIKGRPLTNSSPPCWPTAVLGHLHSSSSPSHLILEELGLVLTTRQSLNKAKDLGINREKCQDRSNVSGWKPSQEPTSSLPEAFCTRKVTCGC